MLALERKNIDEMNRAEEDLLKFIKIIYGHESIWSKNKGMAYISQVKERWREYPFNVEKLEHKMLEFLGEKDVYMTSNTFTFNKVKMSRTSINLWQLKFLYADLDVESLTTYSVEEALQKVNDLVDDDIIPMPTMIVRSGRGLHLYWGIGDYNANDTNKKFWLDTQQALYKKLIHLGADPKVSKDVVRVLRVPGTINSKNGKTVTVEYANVDISYKMLDIKNKYFADDEVFNYPLQKIPRTPTTQKEWINYKKPLEQYLKEKQAKKKSFKTFTKRTGLTHFFNPYTLHKARYDDLMKLLELRGYDVEGQRHHFIHLLTLNYGLTVGDDVEDILAHINGINLELVEPMLPSEVKATVYSTYRYIQEYRNYVENRDLQNKSEMGKESDLKNGPLLISISSVTISTTTEKDNIEYEDNKEIDKNTLPYHQYNNKTIIELLCISEEEIIQMKTLITKRVKLDRKNISRKEKRRTEESGEIEGTKLTPKQKEQMEKKKKAIALLEQGLSKRKVANEMGISLSTLQNLLK